MATDRKVAVAMNWIDTDCGVEDKDDGIVVDDGKFGTTHTPVTLVGSLIPRQVTA